LFFGNVTAGSRRLLRAQKFGAMGNEKGSSGQN
jgi:hypothetical protein